jgi:hypothetical protein
VKVRSLISDISLKRADKLSSIVSINLSAKNSNQIRSIRLTNISAMEIATLRAGFFESLDSMLEFIAAQNERNNAVTFTNAPSKPRIAINQGRNSTTVNDDFGAVANEDENLIAEDEEQQEPIEAGENEDPFGAGEQGGLARRLR